jgi:hypothetical protein
MVCDEELYSMKAPEGYSEMTSGIKNVIVGGKAGKSDLFASATA